MKDISIVTVVYNSIALIENTIKSVVKHSTKFNIEYIIIDGASTDGTLEVIDNYKSDIDILISESDNGIYDAMNKAIEIAQGRYIYYLNAGDILLPNVFDSLNSHVRANFDVIYGNILVGENNVIWACKKIDDILSDMAFSHQAVLVKRNILLKTKFDLKYKIASDYDFFIKLFLNQNTFSKTDVVFVKYDTTGISNTNYFSTVKEYVLILAKQAKGINKVIWPFNYIVNKRGFIFFLILEKLKLLNLARIVKSNFRSIIKVV